MKKNIAKKIATMLTVMCLGTSVQIPVSASDIAETPEISEGAKLLEEMIEEEKVVESSFELSEEEMLSFEKYSDICSYYMEKSQEGEIYPDYISGVVYEEEGINVLTTGDTKQVKDELMTIVDVNDVAVIIVDYTYQELNEMKLEIEQLCENREIENLADRIQSITVDEKENKVTVGIENYSKDDEIILKETISDCEKVSLYKSDIKACKTTLKPGARVWMLFGYNKSGEEKIFGYSVGCRAYRINSSGAYEFGFITAGHSVGNGMKFYISDYISPSNYIGKVTDRRCNGTVDAAFVCVNVSNYSLSNRLAGSDYLKSGGYAYDNFNGRPCIFLGASSGGFLVGKIINDNSSTPVRDEQRKQDPKVDLGEDSYSYIIGVKQPLNNLLYVSTNANILAGDSGGLLYGIKDGEYYVLGICSSVGGKYSYHTKYSEIIKEMGVYIY